MVRFGSGSAPVNRPEGLFGALKSALKMKKAPDVSPGPLRRPGDTYFLALQYHRQLLLDDRVRDGIGYDQEPIVTGNTICGARKRAPQWS